MSSDTSLELNAFALLAVSTRDDARRIMEAADDQSLYHDPEACQHARATLTNPRRRVEAEFAWFPGVAPGTAMKAVEASSIGEVENLPLSGLAMANALIMAASKMPPSSTSDLRQFIENVVAAVDEAQLDQVIREINEDREIAGLPAIANEQIADDAFQSRQHAWRRSVITALDRAPTAEMAEALYILVKDAADAHIFPRFLHEIIDDYALRAQPFMAKEVATAERLIEKARTLAGNRPDALPPIFAAIAELLNTWEELTYPVQMSATLRGRKDRDSENLAFMIRDLSIDLFNKHNLINESRHISELVGSSFSALPQVAGAIAKDGSDLADLETQASAREAEISYAADVGKIFKTRLAISPSGLEWKGKITPLEDVRSVRWGGVNNSVNGISTGTEYLISWYDGIQTTTVEFGNSRIFEAFIGCLWKALMEQIVSGILSHLRSGRELHAGNAVLKDTSVILRRKKFFGDEPAEYDWGDVTVTTYSGSFIINGPQGSKASAALSYRDVDNVHFIEMVVRYAFSKGITRLSDSFG